MKKLHFSLMAILFALFAMVSFTACSSSDDDDAPSQESIKENIVGGRWIPTHYSGWDYIGSGYNPLNPNGDGVIQEVNKDLTLQDGFYAMTFNSDFTCAYYDYYDGGWHKSQYYSSYKVNGNKITVYNKWGNVEDSLNVVSLTSEKMVAEYDLSGDYPGKKYRLTFKKEN